MPAALNLSNEVVKMRAEVKRVKVLIIRKLTRQIFALKKKKGAEADLERNQRRAARLLEEIHKLKALAPDSVTKAALQSDISFEKVCQNKDSSLAERATARIATHPEFSKKIQSLKNAIEAFKAERTSSEKKAKKKSRDQQERESDLDSENEEASEEEEADDYDDDDFHQKIQEADDQKVKQPTMQNKDPVISKESSSVNTPAEVVRMRKEVKKLRVLIIRNLAQQITNLKKEQTDESEPKENVECVARMQKEVQVLRTILPDQVTSRAIERGIDMEKVLQDPESSTVDRAIARICTHTRFAKKLQDVRQSIEEEKVKAVKAGEENEVVYEMMKVEDSDSDGDIGDEEKGETSDEEEEKDEEEDKVKNIKESQPTSKVIPSSNAEPPENTNLAPAREKSITVDLQKVVKSPTNPKFTPKPTVKAAQNLPSKSEPPAPRLKQVSKPDSEKPDTDKKDNEESDLSDSDEEKEYFDDSTEERFHKQSSYSEQSDDDDFFLGKVSKLKKKKSDAAPRKEKTTDPKEARENKASDTPQFKVESVFCSSLSRGSSNKGKHSGPEPRRFSNQKRFDPQGESFGPKSHGFGRGFKNQPPGFREGSKPRGPGGDKTGKPAFERKKPGTHSQQALHPSWEASRKRKEQQAQITAFQGKKIKFDDD